MKPIEPESPTPRPRAARPKVLPVTAVIVGGLGLGVLVELLIAHATSAATWVAAQAPSSLNEVNTYGLSQGGVYPIG